MGAGHIHFFSTRVMKSYFKRLGFKKVFWFETRPYQKSRLYRLLSMLSLIKDTRAPNTFLSKLLCYRAIDWATFFGLGHGMRQRPLPLAKK